MITQELNGPRFQRDGYIVLRRVLDTALLAEVKAAIATMLEPLVGPVEYEADVGYPGSPAARSAQGGDTPRRLLHAYARAQSLRDLALHPAVTAQIAEIFGTPEHDLRLSQCHHNCVMTKYPGHSSATLWHQDIRYWSFDSPDLVSAWFALGDERERNGALRVIPGSHRLELDRGRLDRDLFLRPELDLNRALIDSARSVELAQGDVLLFSSRLFHAAGKNMSAAVKLTPVFTFHHVDNSPIPGTRSALLPSIAVWHREGPAP
ncbi:MAG: phytanoyl-CoA dioxygenase family protein [Pseudomonadota bacterium]